MRAKQIGGPWRLLRSRCCCDALAGDITPKTDSEIMFSYAAYSLDTTLHSRAH